MRIHVPFHRVAATLFAGVFAAALYACSASGNTPQDGDGGDGGGTPGPGPGSGSGSTSSGEGGLFDTDGGLGDGSTAASCQYVDILFVIDNSPSMGPYQEDLAQQFPSFVD